jgi:hypothetical protein
MDHFKTCPNCFETWHTRDDFLSDTLIELNGYKADFEKLDYGLFFFTHMKTSCCSTMAIEVLDFKDLYNGEIAAERKTGSDDCPRYCIDEEQLERCVVICECAFVREVMQLIKDKKSS